jgi:ABC-type microcin C transport system duplicated ATPase subunit YejF
VIVLQAGKIIEMGAAERVFAAPQAPYTQALLGAAGLAPHLSVAPARI